MKKPYLLLLAMLSASLLAGCDGDDKGSETPVPPPANGKRVSTMSIRWDDDVPTTFTLSYDEQGRVTSMNDLKFTYSDDALNVAGTYADPEYPELSYELQYAYSLSDGFVRSLEATQSDGTDTYGYRVSYTYENDRLSTVKYTDGYDVSTMVFHWDGSNISSTTFPESDDEVVNLTYGDVPNNMNIDLFGVIFLCNSGLFDFAMLFDLEGKRCSNLPATIDDGDLGYPFIYEIDGEGYITSITLDDPRDRLVIGLTYK